ncbi:MAG: glycosyltransferase [Ruminococcaceae bacterium]|nr:glycosyltransferase [Oscillospiraceae bacterium]
MKILFVNIGNAGSTGKIIQGISAAAESKGFEVLCAYPDNKVNPPMREHDYIIESVTQKLITRELTYITGLEGGLSFVPTIRLIKKIKEFKPDIIHLHNLHGWYLNLNMLFKFISENDIKIIWTFHDCWPFTGHCTHFQKTNCKKWITGCHSCEQHLDTPKSYLDNSKRMYKLKKKLFLSPKNLTIVTPSNWLANLVRQSFFKDVDIRVIHNGIDRSIFKPTESNFRQRYSLENKKIILGVSSVWGEKKGLDIFIRLANDLDDNYKIVLVGTDDRVDSILPKNIISIHRTNNQIELAEIYSAADVFVNPTREDTFPTVNIEALSCGCPVITFDVCGCTEIPDNTSGIVVPKDDYKSILMNIELVCQQGFIDKKSCVERAKLFDQKQKTEDYINLYYSSCV